jgi:hypothetical protein
MNEEGTKKPLKFTLKKETVMELGFDELAAVAGGHFQYATASCCVGCNTCADTTTGTGTCGGQC